jgi:hypothetical protein
MPARQVRPNRLNAFSDGVFAVIITILAFDLKPPDGVSFSVLLALWPTGVSYAISYLFIAIVWINHHYLLTYVANATPRLIWANFAHLLAVSLIPFSTAWIAKARLAAFPVSFYAGFFCPGEPDIPLPVRGIAGSVAGYGNAGANVRNNDAAFRGDADHLYRRRGGVAKVPDRRADAHQPLSGRLSPARMARELKCLALARVPKFLGSGRISQKASGAYTWCSLPMVADMRGRCLA